jgi:hypothetical protein
VQVVLLQRTPSALSDPGRRAPRSSRDGNTTHERNVSVCARILCVFVHACVRACVRDTLVYECPLTSNYICITVLCVSACVRVRVCVRECMHACRNVDVRVICAWACVFVCVRDSMGEFMRVSVRTCMLHTCVRACVCASKRAWVCMNVCVFCALYVCLCACMGWEATDCMHVCACLQTWVQCTGLRANAY